MIADYWAGLYPTPQQGTQQIEQVDEWMFDHLGYPVNSDNGLPSGDNGSEPTGYDLATVARDEFGLVNSARYAHWTLAQLQQEINNGFPVIVGVYTSMNVGFGYKHFMVVTGLDADYVYVNDPGKNIANGKQHAYPISDFLTAWKANADDAVVVIHPNAPPIANKNSWTWISGASTVGQQGSYGAKGVSSGSNTPGARWNSVSWIDPSGSLWLYGGNSTGDLSAQLLGDLWKYDKTTAMWTWMSGSNAINGAPVYGQRGVPSSGNTPGAREGASSWTDGGGHLWLFGGNSPGPNQFFNDVWKYDATAGTWTWVFGSNLPNSPGVYGQRGLSSGSNSPGSREAATIWIDKNSRVWLFGGFGYDANGRFGSLNDLWSFDTTSSTWTWFGGSNTANAPGVYGTKGTASSSNVPGARTQAASWIDSSGHLWLFGGDFVDSSLNHNFMNDLWRYDPGTGYWTWISGSNSTFASGIYGSLGVSSPSNVPGARSGDAAWIDATGALWLFGGVSRDQAGNWYELNDLWRFDTPTSTWTWVSGSNTSDAPGVYGTLGTSAPANIPGARYRSVTWIDGSGDMWLFGGWLYVNSTTYGTMNDLWRYQP